ncbi:hypothetical protein TTHERM_00277380 (macronuclear) [Tetrahymena thermophila SB210]|uniref:Uncharacterized protein n=1 Tax=Tetrahymena thermophila (strain SB210) TaxID=312017 RepID=I7MEV1_TETTS|nr:hypothetical protein TTHERM_00277380 [Tetrahymena thermophila SB210]EAR97853.2 hypothetical protein TTHERM_00277380 [Tetrahymena thermophila SB210]|eukprot:XP_001018098.2 hypothetical protein TTHERM_00277380 [Tetrahymena thermophila SB210]
MSDFDKELIQKTEKLTIKEKEINQQENINDLEDITPNRGRFFSSMNYKEYVSKFDKPPARPKIMPLAADPIIDNEFSLDSYEQPTETRSYSQSLPMRPLELSGSSSLKSGSEQKTIEEEDEENDEEIGGIEEDPIYPIDTLPQNSEIVNNIIQNNDIIRSRSQSENASNLSIFNFCQGIRKKQNTIIN